MIYPNRLAVVVLAAGKGRRMLNPEMPKVLFPLFDKPLIAYVLDTVSLLSPEIVIPIVGFGKEKVIKYISNYKSFAIEFAEQDEQLGTGHAVMQANVILKDFIGYVLILPGDVPLITERSISNFLDIHYEKQSHLSVLSTIAQNPNGYGRIVRDKSGQFLNITEHKDANDEIREIKEINSGIIVADCELLFDCLAQISNNNAQKEYYLTDIIEIAISKGKNVNAIISASFDELQGINTQEELKIMEKRINVTRDN